MNWFLSTKACEWIQAGITWHNTFLGRHWTFFCSGFVTTASLSIHIADHKVADAAQGATVWSMTFAAILVLSSLVSLLWSKCNQNPDDKKDPHFRRAVVLKGFLLVAHDILLVFPEKSETIPMVFVCAVFATSWPHKRFAHLGNAAQTCCRPSLG